MTTQMVSATDVWEGSHAVDWSNTLNIAADKFVDVAVGQKIVVELNVTEEDVIELHSNGSMLPGTRYVHRLYADNTSAEVFVTQGMLDQLKETGLEVCGKGFTVTKIWYGDGKYNLDMLVLTCGVNGSYVFSKGSMSYLETPKVEVVDTVGAGDAFTGSFVASVLSDQSIAESHRIAVNVSAYVCTQNGAMPMIPDELKK